ncbi:MAG: ATP-grasp domain-containing protein, partial [Deltaproteobacteria bacterium]|nr:ATP-grasp domain-containing protein [Deltaproteobacteria bacterium]
RKSLAAVRALGTKGIQVTVGESTCLATALFSRYCNHAVVYPSPFSRPLAFLDFLHRELSRHSYQMILPMEDETLELISRHHSDFSRLTYLPIVSFQKLHLARCKDKILRLADTLGIPTPKTWFINELSELNSLKKGLPYPVVIKPKISSGAVGISYPENPGELVDRYLRIHEHFPFPMIQEYIPSEGPGYGASFLMDERGAVKASFVHKRIREYPVSGGASTLRKSVKHNEIRELALTLLKSLDWFGVAMVEFKIDPRDGLPKLMEINPRFWGSLSLAVAAGVNFPYLLYRMSQGENFKPIEDYQTEKKCRWLLPGDILHFIDNPHRSRLLSEFFHFWDANTTYDILSTRDPLPALARCLTPLTFIYNQDMKLRLRKRRLLQSTQT